MDKEIRLFPLPHADEGDTYNNTLRYGAILGSTFNGPREDSQINWQGLKDSSGYNQYIHHLDPSIGANQLRAVGSARYVEGGTNRAFLRRTFYRFRTKNITSSIHNFTANDGHAFDPPYDSTDGVPNGAQGNLVNDLTITSASLWVKTRTNDGGTLSTGSFKAIIVKSDGTDYSFVTRSVGFGEGVDSEKFNTLDFNTPYSEPFNLSNTASVNDNVAVLNSTAINDLNNNQFLDFAIVEHENDFLNSAPPAGGADVNRKIASVRTIGIPSYTDPAQVSAMWTPTTYIQCKVTSAGKIKVTSGKVSATAIKNMGLGAGARTDLYNYSEGGVTGTNNLNNPNGYPAGTTGY